MKKGFSFAKKGIVSKNVAKFAIFQASTDEFLNDYVEESKRLGMFKWSKSPHQAKLFDTKNKALEVIKKIVIDYDRSLTLAEIIDIGDKYKVDFHHEYRITTEKKHSVDGVAYTMISPKD